MTEVDGYCRQVETYLCRKNDGHLIRIVGPSFERVSDWAQQGIPIKLVFRGIDRYFERYYSKGARRRPVRIDFCEADVLDLFDEWRRAIGISSRGVAAEPARPSSETAPHASESLPAHLERVVMRLTQARASGSVGAEFDDLVDRVAGELDAARTGRVRGAARQAVIDRLAVLDAELIEAARATVDEPTRAVLAHEAEEELTAFRSSMPPPAFEAARRAAVDRLIRERLALPTISFTHD